MNDFFVHSHSSGRFNKSAASLETLLDDLMQDGHVLTLTEVAMPPRAKTLEERGWSVSQAAEGSKAADCAVLYKNDTFRKVDESFPQLGDATYTNKRGFKTRPIHAAISVLQHRDNGKITLFAVAHLPSGVRTAKGFRRTASQFKAYGPNVKALKSAVQDAIKELKDKGIKVDSVVIACDWNIDIKRGWTRLFLKKNFPGYTVNWKRPYPSRGTLAKAIIDIALLKGIKVIGTPHIHAQSKASDHKPYTERLRVK